MLWAVKSRQRKKKRQPFPNIFANVNVKCPHFVFVTNFRECV